jgi:ABC-type multidrug transport system fused ATPase/permease subunit
MKEEHIVENGTHEKMYHQNSSYIELFNFMARSLNFDKISKTFG